MANRDAALVGFGRIGEFEDTGHRDRGIPVATIADELGFRLSDLKTFLAAMLVVEGTPKPLVRILSVPLAFGTQV
jgi:hypothetical protein